MSRLLDAMSQFVREQRLLETAEYRALKALLALQEEGQRRREENNRKNGDEYSRCEVCQVAVRKDSRYCSIHRVNNGSRRLVVLSS